MCATMVMKRSTAHYANGEEVGKIGVVDVLQLCVVSSRNRGSGRVPPLEWGFGRHEALNVGKNQLHSLHINCETYLLNLITP